MLGSVTEMIMIRQKMNMILMTTDHEEGVGCYAPSLLKLPHTFFTAITVEVPTNADISLLGVCHQPC
jgi:hypothetical protein